MSGYSHGRYRIVAELGRGGMAVVYEARDDALDRSVALKVIHPLLASQPDIVARFIAEARIAAQLDHPNIVPIYDIGDTDGLPFIAMKLVRGASLQQRLSQRPLPVGEGLAILRQVAAGLGYAHAAGVVHRDVKPGNVLIGEWGEALVADFGIARALGANRHTVTGHLVGTPEYLAPECVRGEEASPHSDQYSLAIVAAEMLTGQRPFSGPAVAVLHAQVYDEPAFGAAGQGFHLVLRQGMAKEPARRFASPADFVSALERIGVAAKEREAVAAAPTVVGLPVQQAKAASPWPSRQGSGLLLAQVAPLALVAVVLAVFALGGRQGANAAPAGGATMMESLMSFFTAATATPTATSTGTPTPTRTTTATATPTATPTPTLTATAVPTHTATPLPSPTPSPIPTVVNQERIDVGPGKTRQVTIRLRRGDLAAGSFKVTGSLLGIGNDVVFRIYGPDGTMANVGRVESEYRFQFTAESTGEYRLSFQNPATLSGRVVDLTVTYPDRRRTGEN